LNFRTAESTSSRLGGGAMVVVVEAVPDAAEAVPVREMSIGLALNTALRRSLRRR